MIVRAVGRALGLPQHAPSRYDDGSSSDRPSPVTEDLVDRYLARRTQARALSPRSEAEARLTGDLHASMTKLGRLKDLRYTASFATSDGLDAPAQVAVEALSGGVSRCVTLGYTGPDLQGWDTHANNDAQQSELWQRSG